MTDLLELPGQPTDVGVIFPTNLSYEDWEAVGNRLRGRRESIHWWLGDWMNFGEATFGEKYSQALDQTEYDYAYLRQISFVCKNVPLLRRSNGLSFSHHREVAGMREDDQIYWLQTATEDNMSQKELRAAIKNHKKRLTASSKEELIPNLVAYRFKVTIEKTLNGTISAYTAEEAKLFALDKILNLIKDPTDEDVIINLEVSE